MNIYQQDYNQVPELFTLIKEHRNKEAADFILRNPSSVHLKGWLDHTALHTAAQYNNPEIAEFLISKGADVNGRRTGTLPTPLCWAETASVAEILLNHGAHFTGEELNAATRANRLDLIELYLRKKAPYDLKRAPVLDCRSIDAIKVYQMYGMDIASEDSLGANMLHQIAWNCTTPDDTLLFDFAYHAGVPWKKDKGGVTPYALAILGGRVVVLAHLRKNYPQLTSAAVKEIPAPHLDLSRVCFFKRVSRHRHLFVALTREAELIQLELSNNVFVVLKGITIDIPPVRNFAIDGFGHIVVPTKDNKLLLFSPHTLELLDTQTLEDDATYDQITWLPRRKVFLASCETKWKVTFLNEKLKSLSVQSLDDGIMLPHIEENESFVSIYSFDQNVYHVLYSIQDDYKLDCLHAFFDERDGESSGFCFGGLDYFVCSPSLLSCYSYETGKVEKKWSREAKELSNTDQWNAIALLNEAFLVAGLGNKLLLISRDYGTRVKEIAVPLKGTIKDIMHDSQSSTYIVRTKMELMAISANLFE